MSTEMGADERRIRHILRRRGVGPDALPPRPAPAASAARTVTDSGNWWDALYAADAADTHPDTVRTLPDKARIRGGLIPDWRKGPVADLRGHTADTADAGPKDIPDAAPDKTAPDAEPEPDIPTAPEDWEDAQPDDESTPGAVRLGKQRQQIHTAYTGLERRTRWLTSTGASAGLGWALGLEPALHSLLVQCQHDTGDTTAPVIVGLALVTAGALIVWRTTNWWPPLAWACRIPLASALLALALYAPGATP